MKNYIVTLRSDPDYIYANERNKVIKFSVNAKNLKAALKKALDQTDLDIVDAHIQETGGHCD